ncbi:Ranbp2 [Symbiodinium sp. CCMP2592]|nr:Ranbp2 [Symbiodinium sp. CCMP2592]
MSPSFKSSRIDDTIKLLDDHLADVYHEVDCTRIALDPRFKKMDGSIGAVYYNFPHAGAAWVDLQPGQGHVTGFYDSHPIVNWRHENLMRLFFRNLRYFVKPGGLVKIASNMGAVGVRYSYILGSAEQNEFQHVETLPFLEWSLHRYGRAYGDRRDKKKRPGDGQGYNAQKAESDMVYTFEYRPSGRELPIQEIKFPPTFQTIMGCNDGPFKNLDPVSAKALARQLHERFIKEVSGIHVG